MTISASTGSDKKSPREEAQQPQISIIIPAKNDNFMASFNYRLESTLNYLAQSLDILGRLSDVEIVIGDWGSEVPLYKELVLTEQARAVTRHIIIPPAVAKQAQKDSEFPIVLVQNTTIRRCLGDYIMQTDSDVLFPPKFLQGIFDLIEGRTEVHIDPAKALLGSKRRHIPWNVVSSQLPLSMLDRFIHEKDHLCSSDEPWEYGFCATGMMMMHRNLWAESSGYDESLIHWGWMEIDLGFRMTQKYPWYDVTDELGITLYHMEHYNPKEGERKNLSRKRNPTERPSHFKPNPENWGLRDAEILEFRYPSYEDLIGD